MVSIAKRFATGKKRPHVSDGLCAGLASPMAHLRRDWPRKCHTCTGRLPLRCSFAPVHVTNAFRRNMNKQRRRVWSILHTVVDLCRCHDGTATVLQFDSDGRPTVRIALSLRAIRMHRPRRLHVLQFANGRSALGRIHKRDASRKHRASLFRSPPFNILNLLPRRN